jgi:hypothetical protein
MAPVDTIKPKKGSQLPASSYQPITIRHVAIDGRCSELTWAVTASGVEKRGKTGAGSWSLAVRTPPDPTSAGHDPRRS